MSEVKQIKPNHADHVKGYKEKWLNEMYANEPVIAQPKYDGERMLVHFFGPHVFCTSRRISKKTNEYMRLEDRLHDLLDAYASRIHWEYTVLDCECYSKDWSTIVGILHSLPDRARELSKLNTPQFAVFDCLYYNGNDIREKTYLERLRYAACVVANMNYEPMHLVKFINDNFEPDDITNAHFFNSIDEQEQAMTKAVELGFEGIVIKSLNKKYEDTGASLKCKKFETVDVVVYDYKQGTGKYSNTVGALCVGYYDADSGKIVHVSQVNCGTDLERDMWRDNWATLQNSVIEVKCQEVTESSLRHPVYVRLREDKNYIDCTKETVFKKI